MSQYLTEFLWANDATPQREDAAGDSLASSKHSNAELLDAYSRELWAWHNKWGRAETMHGI